MHGELLRQVHDGDFDLRVMGYAAGGPPSGVAAYIEQCADGTREDDFQRLIERAVGVVVMRSRTSFSVPAAEGLTTLRRSWTTFRIPSTPRDARCVVPLRGERAPDSLHRG